MMRMVLMTKNEYDIGMPVPYWRMAQAPVRPPLGIVFGKSTDVQARQYTSVPKLRMR